MNDIAANKALITAHMVEIVNDRRVPLAYEQVADDFLDHGNPSGARGPEATVRAMQHLFGAIPDVRIRLDDLLADGDRVAARATWYGTHHGPLFGVPGTGRPIEIHGMVFWRIRDGKITDRWANIDLSALRATGTPA